MASGATGTYGFPYPLQTDGVDVAGDVQALATAIEIEFLTRAPLDSPALIGTPTAPTASAATNTTQIATTAYVKSQSYLTTTLAASTYAPIASPTFTGTVTLPLTTAGVLKTTAAGVISSQALLQISNGGTNASATPTAGAVAFGTGSAYAFTAAGTSGQFLQSAGSGTPVWANVVGSLYQASAPGSPQTGTLWTDSDIDVLYVYNGSGWHSPMGVERNPQTASYTLVLADRAKLVEISNASANTLTVPPNSSVAFPIGTQIQILQTGAGQTTLTQGAGVTINGTPGLKLRTQWSSATIIKRATDTWVAIGDLAA